MVHVLIVDSNADDREAQRAAVQPVAERVYEAPDGTSAVRMLRLSPTPLVVMVTQPTQGLRIPELLQSARAGGPLARHQYLVRLRDAASLSPEVQRALSALAAPILDATAAPETIREQVLALARQLPDAEALAARAPSRDCETGA
jgi:CheY-like chemotaxis protein